MVNLLGIPASNSDDSINAMLVRCAIEIITAKFEFAVEHSILDLNDFEMPIYKSQRETVHGIPDQAKTFVRAIESSDALIISFAEHNGNYSAAFKNVFDWASRINQKVYRNKSLLLMATSPGSRGGKAVLDIASSAAPYFGGEVFGTFSLPSFNDTFDRKNEVITDATKMRELSGLLGGFAEKIVTNKSDIDPASKPD